MAMNVFNADNIAENPSVGKVIDELGLASAEAQGILNPMTSVAKLRANERLYLYSGDEMGDVAGFIKVGVKHLYHYDKKGVVKEIDPLCVLDFYVCGSFRRKGIGRKLINGMMEAEEKNVRHLAWDKPTAMSLALLKKYYGMSNFVPQPNNFVVFEDFFA